MLRDDLMRGAEAAAGYSGLSRKSIYSLCERGFIPHVKLGGVLFFRKIQLDIAFTDMQLGKISK